MTQVEFWRLLAKAGRKNKWALDGSDTIHEGDIRCERGACPILAVYHLVFPKGDFAPTTYGFANGSYAAAASELGLSPHFAESIMLAADGPVDEDATEGKTRLFQLRKKLLKTLRIKVAS